MKSVNFNCNNKDFENFKNYVYQENFRDFWDKNGFIHVTNILTPDEVKIYSEIYDEILSGKIDASNHRHDLGNINDLSEKKIENICQIMWPTLYVENLDKGPIHIRTEFLAKYLFGDDMIEDFNFLICKEPFKDIPTFWHSDESYWLDLPDKRAVSFWVALDRTYVENGCMWFVPGSNNEPLRPHRKYHPEKHIRICDADESEGIPVPLQPGEMTGHGGRTLHYRLSLAVLGDHFENLAWGPEFEVTPLRGNSTADRRRGFVVNYRPKAMVELERQKEFDHGKSGLSNILDKH